MSLFHPKPACSIEVRAFNGRDRELAETALRASRLLATGTGEAIAIVVRDSTFIGSVAARLRHEGLDIQAPQSTDLLTNPLIQQVLRLLNYIATEHHSPGSGDNLLFEILHDPAYDVPATEIARTANLLADANQRSRGKKRCSLRRYVREQAGPKDLFDPGLHPTLCAVTQSLEELIALMDQVPLAALIDQVFAHLGADGTGEDRQLLPIQQRFRWFAAEDLLRHPDSSLTDLLERIQVAYTHKEQQQGGLALLTAADAVGCSFDYVFLIGCTAAHWEGHGKPLRGLPARPEDALPGAAADSHERLQEFFDGLCGGARKGLYCSWSSTTPDGLPEAPSLLLTRFAAAKGIPMEPATDKGSVTSITACSKTPPVLPPTIAPLPEELTTRMLATFQMNVSALNNFLRCPLEFYFRNVLRVAAPKSAAAEFGSAVHHALEQLFVRRKEGKQQRFPTLETVLQDFTGYMERSRTHFSNTQFAERIAQGYRILEQYYQRLPQAAGFVLVEQNLRSVPMEGLLLKGKIDKLELRGNEVTIVDYKTGNPAHRHARFEAPGASSPLGGDYWRQAVFYAILVSAWKPVWQIQRVVFDYIEPDENGQFLRQEVQVNKEAVNTVKQQIHHADARIRARQFNTGCGTEGCHWCRFVRENRLSTP